MNTNASYPFETLKLDWPHNREDPNKFVFNQSKGRSYKKIGFGGGRLLHNKKSVAFLSVNNADHAEEQSKEIESIIEPQKQEKEKKDSFATFPKELKRKEEADEIKEKYEYSPVKKAEKLEELQKKTIFDDL